MEQATAPPIAPAAAKSGPEDLFSHVAPGVARLGIVFVNLYVIDLPGGGWVLIDTGLPNFAWYVRKAVIRRYGKEARPQAIILTHGHFDHAGNARELAEGWDVPIYAHPLELPYLEGHSDYAPQDPTPGGAISFLSRFFPTHGIDLGNHVQPLPADGSAPGLADWKWIHTPGHTAGHISLWRESDHVVIAGDAVVTTDLDAWSSQMTWPRELARPPTPLTPDWEAARRSISDLAELEPRTIAAGHGLVMQGEQLGEDLRAFARSMAEPPGGRYTGHPVVYAPDGSVEEVPPAVADPLGKQLAVGAAAIAVLVGVWAGGRKKRQSEAT